jgi:hypothetical protein
MAGLSVMHLYYSWVRNLSNALFGVGLAVGPVLRPTTGHRA